MSQFNPRHSRRPALPYWASMALWALFGPWGAGAASCGRWARACLEAALTLGALEFFHGGLSMALAEGASAVGRALINGTLSWAQACLAALCSCMALVLWISDYWRIKSWHGRKSDPLLDITTQSPAEP